MAIGGEVFILDMGDPVRIADLARQMIHLSGFSVRDSLNTTGDIQINYTGLRPGEKLFEELLIGVDSSPTSHPLISKANESRVPQQYLQSILTDFDSAFAHQSTSAVIQSIKALVPEYSKNSRISPENIRN